MISVKSARRIFPAALAALCLLAAACGGSDGTSSERLFDIEATTCLPREGRASRILVLPGEKIRFRVYNNTSEMMEFIVTDEAGAELRREKLQPSFRIVDPAEAALGGFAGAGEFAAAEFAHDGHEDEVGPDATEDYKYRMLIQPGPDSVRNMLITFPEIAEGYVLNRAICADPNSLTQVVVTEIARR